jgi:aldehyde dehydrogenase (NAD+)
LSPYDPDALIIDGAEVQPRSTQYIDIISPSTEKVIGRAPAAGPEDVALAVGAARAAYERGDWRRMPVSDRVAILERAVDSLESRTAEIAHLVTSQMGLPITLSQQAIPNAFTAARFFMAIAPDVLSPDLRPGATSAVVLKEPVGVVAAIAPWNGPFNMAMFKLIPALAHGRFGS